jgi:hypothetical protein
MDGTLRAITASNQVGLKNLVLSHTRKWHRATLRVQMVSSAGKSMNEKLKSKITYTFWQANKGIHCTVTLKQVVTVWIVALALQLDILL